VADDALVHQMEFRVGALALDRSCVPDFIAGLEQRDVRTDGIHDTRGVKAEILTSPSFGSALANLIIHRIGGNRFHRDADIARAAPAYRPQIEQRIRRIDRQRFPVTHSFH
jgi:hypothetical protein